MSNGSKPPGWQPGDPEPEHKPEPSEPKQDDDKKE